MRTIQVVMEEDVLLAADGAAQRAHVNRSQLIRQALVEFLARARERELEELHRSGYEKNPVELGEFDHWDAVLAWPQD